MLFGVVQTALSSACATIAICKKELCGEMQMMLALTNP
jgi:hypothetical protein